MDIWGMVGKLGALLALVATGVSLLRFVFVKRHKVVFRTEVVRNPSPKLQEHLATAIKETMPDVLWAIDLMLQEKSTSLTSGLPRSVRDFSDQASERMIERLGYTRELRPPSELLRVELENKGKKAAKNVVVDFDFEPIYFEASSKEIFRDGATLRMQELRAGQKVIVNLWGDASYRDDVRVSHDDHVVKRWKVAKVFGWRAIVVSVLDVYMLPLVMFPLAVVVVALATQWILSFF
jgi:hypothetical protein